MPPIFKIYFTCDCSQSAVIPIFIITIVTTMSDSRVESKDIHRKSKSKEYSVALWNFKMSTAQRAFHSSIYVIIVYIATLTNLWCIR